MASNSPEVKKKGVPAAERNCNPISLKSGAGQAACAGEMAAKIKFLIDLGMTQHDIAAHFKIKDTSLNPEDTHITDSQKLASLIVIVMPTVTWAYRCATHTMGMKAMPRKSHGRREKSWFRMSFDALNALPGACLCPRRA
jgi:hypothetical protein